VTYCYYAKKRYFKFLITIMIHEHPWNLDVLKTLFQCKIFA
jgi:hypothetical protein